MASPKAWAWGTTGAYLLMLFGLSSWILLEGPLPPQELRMQRGDRIELGTKGSVEWEVELADWDDARWAAANLEILFESPCFLRPWRFDPPRSPLRIRVEATGQDGALSIDRMEKGPVLVSPDAMLGRGSLDLCHVDLGSEDRVLIRVDVLEGDERLELCGPYLFLRGPVNPDYHVWGSIARSVALVVIWGSGVGLLILAIAGLSVHVLARRALAGAEIG